MPILHPINTEDKQDGSRRRGKGVGVDLCARDKPERKKIE